MHRCGSRSLASSVNNIPRAVELQVQVQIFIYMYVYVCTSDVSMRFGIALSSQSYVSFPESLLRCLWSLCCALLIRESALSDFVNIPSICFHICSVYNLIGAGSICGPIGFVLEKLNREIKTRYTIYMCMYVWT